VVPAGGVHVQEGHPQHTPPMLWTGAYCEASVWVNPGRTRLVSLACDTAAVLRLRQARGTSKSPIGDGGHSRETTRGQRKRLMWLTMLLRRVVHSGCVARSDSRPRIPIPSDGCCLCGCTPHHPNLNVERRCWETSCRRSLMAASPPPPPQLLPRRSRSPPPLASPPTCRCAPALVLHPFLVYVLWTPRSQSFRSTADTRVHHTRGPSLVAWNPRRRRR
jgi:hypothetical protein